MFNKRVDSRFALLTSVYVYRPRTRYRMSDTLKEDYECLDLTLINIESGFLAVYSKCSLENNLTDNKIINELNSEFIYADVTFIKSEQVKGIIPTSRKFDIYYGENINGMIYIYVGNKFLDLFKEDFEKQQYDFSEVSKEIMSLYAHEFTHRNQFLQTNKITDEDNIDIEQVKKNPSAYLENFHEIDAHARAVASKLLFDKISEKQAVTEFSKGKNSDFCKYVDYYKYYDTFGKNSEKLKQINKNHPDYKELKNKEKIWHRFLKRILDFMSLDEYSMIESNPFNDI